MSGEIFGHNRSRSQCFQVQLATCLTSLGFSFLHGFEAYSTVGQVFDFVTNLQFQYLKINQKQRIFGFRVLRVFTTKDSLVPFIWKKKFKIKDRAVFTEEPTKNWRLFDWVLVFVKSWLWIKFGYLKIREPWLENSQNHFNNQRGFGADFNTQPNVDMFSLNPSEMIDIFPEVLNLKQIYFKLNNLPLFQDFGLHSNKEYFASFCIVYIQLSYTDMCN